MRIIIKTVLLFFLVMASATQAAEGLKAGDVDPATGKVLEYWVAPMDPTYARIQRSERSADLVSLYHGCQYDPIRTSRHGLHLIGAPRYLTRAQVAWGWMVGQRSGGEDHAVACAIGLCFRRSVSVVIQKFI